MCDNLTVEELEAKKCATDGIHAALTSQLMFVSHVFILSVVLISFVAIGFALKILWKQNVFPNSTRVILIAIMFGGSVHQCTMAVIRIRSLNHSFLYSSDPCSIQFRTSECIVETSFYYTTNFFCSFSMLSLFLDRLFSFRLRSSYHKYQMTASIFFSLCPMICASLLFSWIVWDDPLAGYVPSCVYPPQMSQAKFYGVNYCRICGLFAVFVLSCVILVRNKQREKRIVHNVFDTESRYKSYENLLATNAVCLIIFVEIVCIISTAIGNALLHTHKNEIPEIELHSMIAFTPGVAYSNMLLPIIIYLKTIQIIKRRSVEIRKMRMKREKFSDHFATLDVSWKRY